MGGFNSLFIDVTMDTLEWLYLHPLEPGRETLNQDNTIMIVHGSLYNACVRVHAYQQYSSVPPATMIMASHAEQFDCIQGLHKL